jgi:hypothetical protein
VEAGRRRFNQCRRQGQGFRPRRRRGREILAEEADTLATSRRANSCRERTRRSISSGPPR